MDLVVELVATSRSLLLPLFLPFLPLPGLSPWRICFYIGFGQFRKPWKGSETLEREGVMGLIYVQISTQLNITNLETVKFYSIFANVMVL